MEPKKEYSQHEDNGKKITRSRYDDPETKTHVVEIKIEGSEEGPDKKAQPVCAYFSCSLPEHAVQHIHIRRLMRTTG